MIAGILSLSGCRLGYDAFDDSTVPTPRIDQTSGTAHLLWGTPFIAGRCSTPITIALQEEPTSPTSVRLTDSTGGKFYIDSDCTTPITDISFESGERWANAYYRNPVAGITVLTAATDSSSTAFWSGVSEHLVGNPGSEHSCTVLASGLTQCWGLNNNGQLGDGTTQTRTQPAGVTTPEDLRWIAGGNSHSCALTQDGRILCVGANTFGQLGSGNNLSTNLLTPVVGISDAVALHVSSTGFHSCAVRRDGTVACWGLGQFGRLGNDSTTTPDVPVDVFGLQGAVSVAVGYQHSCAIVRDGTVRCWGRNSRGQLLGDGSLQESQVPMPVPGLSGIVYIAAASDGTCARAANGRSYCWGSGIYQSLTEVEELSDAITIAHGASVVCGIDRSGGVQCNGANSFGQLGNGAFGGTGWTPVLGARPATHIGYGGNHGCISIPGLEPMCWGRNHYGALGTGQQAIFFEPVDVLQGTSLQQNVLALALGGGVNTLKHGCAIAGDGQVMCWGANNNGQLGNGNSGLDALSAAPVAATTSQPAVEVQAGQSHSCARLADQTVECWGTAMINATNATIPTTVPGLSSVVQLDAATTFTCAATQGQEAYCWGINASGQLGDGTEQLRTSPVLFGQGTLDPIQQVVTGYTHTCARTTLNEVFCSGDNSRGQLGDNSINPSSTPVEVTGFTQGVIDIAAGENFTCAVMSDQTVRCWGDNRFGQLGVTGVSESLVPIEVTGLSQGLRVSAGRSHACAVLVDRTAWCWGSNSYGQLGTGTGQGTFPPAPVPSLSDVRELRTGTDSTCAILSANGAVRCWGSNSTGQLGLGYFGNSPFPQSVTGF